MKNKSTSLVGGEFVAKMFLVGDLIQNVTDFEQKEQIIQESYEYAESIVDTVREPLIVLDTDLKVVTANRTFYQTFKTKPEETQGQLIYDIGNRQWDIPKLRALLEKILPKNTSFDNYEVEHVFPHIGKRTMLLNARRIPRPPAKPRIILLAIEDITERKQIEQIANESREYAESIVDTVREPLIVLDTDLKVVSANRTFYQTFKTKPEETQGQLIYDIGNQQWNIPKLRALLEEILPRNASFENFEVEHVFPHIGKRTMLLNARRIPKPPAKPRIILLAIEDITERKQIEQKLNEAYHIKKYTAELEMINENLDSFAYSISHDLRAPLRTISGFAQVLMDKHSDKVNEEMRHYLNRISEGAKKMGQLIDDLLCFSRVTRGEIKYEKINVQNIVNDLIKAYRDIELNRDIEFIVNPLGEVEADKEMLKVIFSNLLQNAIKFTIDRKKACIEIGSEQKKDHIQFYVKDNGIGFDMRYKDKLFEAFQKLQTDERFTGTGLGLSTVKRIVTKHGGNIWAKGEIDKGAEFCFTLPFPKRILKIDK